MAIQRRREDRRVQRTRHALQQAFLEVVREKGFEATSIQDITERANVNRGTFYLHFADKYMVLDASVREDFQRLLTNTLPPASQWNRETLRLLIWTMLDYFGRKYRHQPHIPRSVAPLVEKAIHGELTAVLLTWLKHYGGAEAQWQVPAETIASIVSWAIFGAVIQWSQEETTLSAQQMTEHILLVIMEGMAHLVPTALPE